MNIQEFLNQLPEEKRQEVKLFITNFLADNVITDKERSILHKIVLELGIDAKTIDDLVDDLVCRRKELNSLVDLFLSNHNGDTILEDERSLLTSKAEELGIDADIFNAFIDKKIEALRPAGKEKETAAPEVETGVAVYQPQETGLREYPTKKRKHKSKGRSSWLLWLSMIIILLCAGCIYMMKRGNAKGPVPLDKLVEDNPSLVFQTATMQKYLVWGTPAGTSAKFAKLQVFQVQAEAEFTFDLTKLKTDPQRTDKSNGILYLTYASDTYFPFSVDVRIPQDKVVEIEKINPEAISRKEAEEIAKPVSAIAAGLGGVVGGKVGGKLGSTYGITGKLIGSGVGALLGGGAAGYSSYVWTRNFLCGLKLSPDISIGQTEEFISASKAILADEMLNLNLDGEKELESLRNDYQKDIEKQIQSLWAQWGWTEVHIDFEYNSKQIPA